MDILEQHIRTGKTHLIFFKDSGIEMFSYLEVAENVINVRDEIIKEFISKK